MEKELIQLLLRTEHTYKSCQYRTKDTILIGLG
jgi:hypothetical protein